MLKHLGLTIHHHLWVLIKAVFHLNDFPNQWKEVYIYLIPKLSDWHYHLDKTCSITLLNIVKKVVVKLIMNQLMIIFVQHFILKGFNFATLPHSFTFELLRII